MQKLRQENSAVISPKQDQDNILHFSFLDVLPIGHILVLNRALGTFSYLAVEDDRARLLAQQQFTSSELSILLPLLDSYPYYCPYKVLFAHFYHNTVTEQIIERCHQRLQQAQEDGMWDQEMKSVRNTLSRTRLKIRTLGIDISSILETGYILRFL